MEPVTRVHQDLQTQSLVIDSMLSHVQVDILLILVYVVFVVLNTQIA